MKKLVLLPLFLIISTTLLVMPKDKYSRQQEIALASSTMTSTPVIDTTPDVTPTPKPNISDFKIDCYATGYYEPLFSPSGNWVALQCTEGSTPGLIVVNRNGTSRFIEYNPYSDNPDLKIEPMEGAGLFRAKWTADDKYLYFTTNRLLDGGGICSYGSNSVGLFRLTVDSGDVSAIFPVNREIPRMLIFTFSPEARYLAYTKYSPPDSPVILDMKSGEEINLPVNAFGIGNLCWSNDSKMLAFIACSIDPDNEELSIERVFNYSLSDNKVNQVYEGFHENIYLEGFDENNRLVINHQTTSESGRLYFDLESNKMVVETPED